MLRVATAYLPLVSEYLTSTPSENGLFVSSNWNSRVNVTQLWMGKSCLPHCSLLCFNWIKPEKPSIFGCLLGMRVSSTLPSEAQLLPISAMDFSNSIFLFAFFLLLQSDVILSLSLVLSWLEWLINAWAAWSNASPAFSNLSNFW